MSIVTLLSHNWGFFWGIYLLLFLLDRQELRRTQRALFSSRQRELITVLTTYLFSLALTYISLESSAAFGTHLMTAIGLSIVIDITLIVGYYSIRRIRNLGKRPQP